MSGQASHGDIQQSKNIAWPVLSGLMPPLADSYTPRTESGLALASSLNPGETVEAGSGIICKPLLPKRYACHWPSLGACSRRSSVARVLLSPEGQ